MSGFTNEQQSGSSAPVERTEIVFELPAAQRMLPLVRRIGDDILEANRALARLLPELDVLDRKRRHLEWPHRRRRYQLQEEVVLQEARLEDALAELEVLGVLLLDPLEARLGFPTVVNNRRAYIVWRPGEMELRQWQFAGEATLHPIPANWLENAEMNVAGNR